MGAREGGSMGGGGDREEEKGSVEVQCGAGSEPGITGNEKGRVTKNDSGIGGGGG